MVNDDSSSTDTDALPFGSFGPGPTESSKKKRSTKKKRASKKAAGSKAAKSSDDADEGDAPRTTKKRSKKAASKKAASKKAASKKTASKKTASKKAGSKKSASRKTTRKVADDEPREAAEAAPKKKRTKKSPAKRAEWSASEEQAAPKRGEPEVEAERGGGAEAARAGDGGGNRKDWRRPANRRGSARRGGRRRGGEHGGDHGDAQRSGSPSSDSQRARATAEAHEAQLAGSEAPAAKNSGADKAEAPKTPYSQPLMKKSRFAPAGSKPKGEAASAGGGGKKSRFKPKNKPSKPDPVQTTCEGMLITDKGGHGKLRQLKNMYLPDRKEDVHLGPQMIQRLGLRDGSIIKGRFGKGFGKHKWDLLEVFEVDGQPPAEAKRSPDFKKLVSIDPDFHYALGDLTDDTCLRVIDLICPVGRGTRGLLVAPPRAGKTTLMKKFAQGLEKHYPDVKVMVLLVDERPEEATDWKRSIKSDVFVSTNDEGPKNHVELAEAVWARCQRLVEMGEEVVLLMDSITRLARAYNHVKGDSGKTMSGGVDARAMERPKQFFGAARNTETAGSLTILGTTLIETGSRMDQVIFEEFKGTGNMELVLSRKLADRRIFPAIDVERSGTRKEEKLVSEQRLRRMTTLRRVLARMHWAEAMELLITKLDDVEKNDDFLARFEVDPEA